MPPHSEQIVSRICGALFRGSLNSCPRRLLAPPPRMRVLVFPRANDLLLCVRHVAKARTALAERCVL
ncbi:hypothetical protein BRN18_04725 [Xanthomonas oryzae pv. oryzae]|nr:hypothetical protein BRM88_07250 [Xanthomonas oryzae pv. oryzae]RBC29858.1 hypothetical protein BRM89_21390 [Xanthomonas oryzae pv. oryzae]RBC37612.1 hypothetical protein BRN41_22205 [Xanthomonas oryzae pv. oryzae]RBC48151.1 hypothetical protein BRN44_23510 [Xanthomonas oryzae pv. oryzae]RBD02186.1 hypothetical protein BRN42_21635 [Xanthomonas oryzae pv. oryzae]